MNHFAAMARAVPESRSEPPTEQPSAVDKGKTRWSLILRAQGRGPKARAALGELIGRYEPAVLLLIQSRPRPPTFTADELKQEFFTRVLSRGDVDTLCPERGTFRGWLYWAVRHFINNEWKRYWAKSNIASKIDPGALDDLTPASPDLDPEQAFLRSIAESTVMHALARHRDEYADKALFDALSRLLPGPQLHWIKLGALAQALRINRNNLAARICRLKVRHRKILEQAVADTLALDVNDPGAKGAIEREMCLFYRCLEGG